MIKNIIFLFILFVSINIFGCKCNVQSFGENFAQNDFVAEIEILKTYNVDFKNDKENRFYKADIKILKLYKGKTISTILIRGKVGEIFGPACEVNIEKGEKFLVYLNTKSNFGMSSCTPKTYLSDKSIETERAAIQFMQNHKIAKSDVFYFYGDYFKKFKNISVKNKFAVYKIDIDSHSKAKSIIAIQNFDSEKDSEIMDVIKKKIIFLKDFMTEIKNEEVVLILFFNPETEEVISNFNH